MSGLFEKHARALRLGFGTNRARIGLGLVAGWLSIVALWPSGALTQSADQATEIIRSLAPIAGQTVAPGNDTDRRSPVQVGETTIYVDISRSVSLEVYFAYDSAEITRKTKHQLAALASALSSEELAPHRYLVAGHTDATGSDAYNVDLSQRRAISVRNYLVGMHPIDPQRLMAVGFGFRHLKRPETPYAAINRRVEVSLIVP